jgi:hypothetical protein
MTMSFFYKELNCKQKLYGIILLVRGVHLLTMHMLKE